MKKLLLIFLIFFSKNVFAQEGQKYIPDPDSVIKQQLEDWQDLKFGLLMHWGTYSQWSIVESWNICPEDIPWGTGERKKGENEDDYYAYKKNMKT